MQQQQQLNETSLNKLCNSYKESNQLKSPSNRSINFNYIKLPLLTPEQSPSSLSSSSYLLHNHRHHNSNNNEENLDDSTISEIVRKNYQKL
jgi:hypothetical protein